jgi:hypothetical protein
METNIAIVASNTRKEGVCWHVYGFIQNAESIKVGIYSGITPFGSKK